VKIDNQMSRDRARREIYRMTNDIMAVDPECQRHLTKRCGECTCDPGPFAFAIALDRLAGMLGILYAP